MIKCCEFDHQGSEGIYSFWDEDYLWLKLKDKSLEIYFCPMCGKQSLSLFEIQKNEREGFLDD